MNDSRRALIRDLAADLEPVRQPGRTAPQLLAWLSITTLYGVAIVLATGRFRGDAFAAALAAPAFALELFVAAAAIALLGHAALRLAIPGDRSRWRLALPLVALGAWLGLLAWGLLAEPALPPSMLDKREHCFSETLIFSVPSFLLLLQLVRGLMPLWPRAIAALAGAGSAGLPALLMQLACLYEPAHALTHHLSPIAILALLGAAFGPLVLRRRVVMPRKPDAAIH